MWHFHTHAEAPQEITARYACQRISVTDDLPSLNYSFVQIGFAVCTDVFQWILVAVGTSKELLSPGLTFVSDVNVLRPQCEGRCDDFFPVGLVQSWSSGMSE